MYVVPDRKEHSTKKKIWYTQKKERGKKKTNIRMDTVLLIKSLSLFLNYFRHICINSVKPKRKKESEKQYKIK